ncbi:glycosyltransferase involved in cell wall biosynthesis [Pseudarthrobacter oxydans]|nr:hypothetical protein [Pseudarthrobacter oxydans]MDR6790960.1 glycosyltransferase involved in cell wall biosynthesis [Pseudarthrobacter oxydans]
MPAQGRSRIEIPQQVLQGEFDDIEQLVGEEKAVVLVSNANAGHISVLRIAGALRRKGVVCKTVAILHNYPGSRLRTSVVKAVLRKFDNAIAVEPGLSSLRPDALIPSWLSAAPKISAPLYLATSRQGVIKSFARPDPSKGMHLLKDIYLAMERIGFTCQVALGDPLESHRGYVNKLKSDLSPWLVSGRRSAEWLNPGDIFVVPSIYGEAACLSAQEAMSRGAFVVASRVGLMPYLSPTNEGIRTFALGDTSSAISVLQDVCNMTPEVFLSECRGGATEMARRNLRWFDEVSNLLFSWDLQMPGSLVVRP